jgi:serine protease Do
MDLVLAFHLPGRSSNGKPASNRRFLISSKLNRSVTAALREEARLGIMSSVRIPHTILIIALLSASAAAGKAQASSPDPIARIKRAVVVVTTFDKQDRPLLQGSGFFITDGRVVTNLHVIRNAERIRIKTFTRKIAEVTSVVATDAKSDLALLQIDNVSLDVTTLDIEDAVPTEGESITLVSNPQGSEWKVSHGLLGTIWDFAGAGKRLQITASLYSGSSGGPVLNQRGYVIGVAVMHTDSGDALNFAVPAENLKALQASAKVAPDKLPVRNEIAPALRR